MDWLRTKRNTGNLLTLSSKFWLWLFLPYFTSYVAQCVWNCKGSCVEEYLYLFTNAVLRVWWLYGISSDWCEAWLFAGIIFFFLFQKITTLNPIKMIIFQNNIYTLVRLFTYNLKVMLGNCMLLSLYGLQFHR